MIRSPIPKLHRVLSCTVGIAIVVAITGCSADAADLARDGIRERKQVFDSLLLESVEELSDSGAATDAIKNDHLLGGEVQVAVAEPEGLDPGNLNYPLTAIFKMSAPDSKTMELTVVFTGRADEGGGLSGDTAVLYLCRQYTVNLGRNADVSDSAVDCPLPFDNLSRTEIIL